MKIEITNATEINKLHTELCGLGQTALEKAMRIGELLAEEKAKLKHGEWLPWLKANVFFSERTAHNYLRVYGKREELKSATVADLTDAYRLLAGEPESEDALMLLEKALALREQLPTREQLDTMTAPELARTIVLARQCANLAAEARLRIERELGKLLAAMGPACFPEFNCESE